MYIYIYIYIYYFTIFSLLTTLSTDVTKSLQCRYNDFVTSVDRVVSKLKIVK